MVDKIKHFWINGLSVYEAKFSSLVLVMFIVVGFGMWGVVKFGDIPNNVMFLLQTLIAAITGINIFGNKEKKEGDL